MLRFCCTLAPEDTIRYGSSQLLNGAKTLCIVQKWLEGQHMIHRLDSSPRLETCLVHLGVFCLSSEFAKSGAVLLSAIA